jgi:hypothetical protein
MDASTERSHSRAIGTLKIKIQEDKNPTISDLQKGNRHAVVETRGEIAIIRLV